MAVREKAVVAGVAQEPKALFGLVVCAMAGAAALLVACSGCQQPLFPENAPSTQFERYDALRSGTVAKEEPDVFGRPQPALRARLTPKTPQ